MSLIVSNLLWLIGIGEYSSILTAIRLRHVYCQMERGLQLLNSMRLDKNGER